MRIVLDTSVLIAALRSERGAAAELLRQVSAGRYELCLDLKLFLEYCEVCQRAEHVQVSGMSRSQIDTFLQAIKDMATPIHVNAKLRPLLRDPDDEMVLNWRWQLTPMLSLRTTSETSYRHILYLASESSDLPKSC